MNSLVVDGCGPIIDPLSAVDFLDSSFMRDPYQLYKKLVAEYPIFYSHRHGRHFAFSYKYVRKILASTSFTVDSPLKASRVLFGKTVADVEGDDHKRLRAILGKTFNIKAHQDYCKNFVRPVVGEMLSEIDDSGPRDWVNTFCNVAPMNVMAKIIGIPQKKYAFFRECSISIISYLDYASEVNRKLAMDACFRLEEFLREWLSSIKVSEINNENLIASLLKESEMHSRISTDEIVSQIMLMIPAATDTTNRLIATCMFFLCKDLYLQNELRKDTTMIEAFVLEVLRYEPPVHSVVRFATNNVEFGKLEIPKGAVVTVNVAAANRDPDFIPDAHVFNPFRMDNRKSMSFGFGKHQCLGQNLATVEVCEVIEMLLRRFDQFKFHPKYPSPVIEGTTFRSPNEMFVQVQSCK